jgi:hypothetical protein
MLRHLARFEDDMSTEWLRGEPQATPWNQVDWERDPVWDWRTAADDAPDALYGGWQAAVDRSRRRSAEVVATEEGRAAGLPSIPCVLVNVIEE